MAAWRENLWKSGKKVQFFTPPLLLTTRCRPLHTVHRFEVGHVISVWREILYLSLHSFHFTGWQLDSLVTLQISHFTFNMRWKCLLSAAVRSHTSKTSAWLQLHDTMSFYVFCRVREFSQPARDPLTDLRAGKPTSCVSDRKRSSPEVDEVLRFL